MKKLTVIGAILLGAATLSVSPVSLNWSPTQGVSVSQDKAYAVIGRLSCCRFGGRLVKLIPPSARTQPG